MSKVGEGRVRRKMGMRKEGDAFAETLNIIQIQAFSALNDHSGQHNARCFFSSPSI